MAKAILEFDLNDLDDIRAHMRATKALDMAMVLWELAYNTKKGIHNRIEFENINAYDAVNLVFNALWDELIEHGINLDDLIN